MDLYAYTQIDDLQELARKNGINIPRLRGYRFMKDEIPMKEDYKEEEEFIKHHIYKDAIHSCPMWNTNSDIHEYSEWKRYLEKYYGILDDKGELIDLQWNKINRKKRKAIKMAIRKQLNNYKKQVETFNKYVGKDDVLYIHSRIGGKNWEPFGGYDLVKQPWFIEKVDDYFDDTYCDIYARLEVK